MGVWVRHEQWPFSYRKSDRPDSRLFDNTWGRLDAGSFQVAMLLRLVLEVHVSDTGSLHGTVSSTKKHAAFGFGQ